MKILIFSPPLNSGGASSAFLNMMKSVLPTASVHLITHIPEDIRADSPELAEITTTNLPYMNRYRYFISMTRLLKHRQARIETDFDYLWVQTWDGYCLQFTNNLKIATIITHHNRTDFYRFNRELGWILSPLDYLSQFSRYYLNAKMINSAQLVIYHAMSTYVADGIRRVSNQEIEYFILPNAYIKDDQQMVEEVNPINIPDDKIVIITSGYVPRKGIHRIIHAVGSKEISIDDIIIIVFGGPSSLISRVYFTYLKHLTQKLQLEDHIYFLGYISSSEKRSLLKRADFFWEASYSEAHSLAPIEASIYDTSIISTGVGGTLEFLDQAIPYQFKSSDKIEYLLDKLHADLKFPEYNQLTWSEWGQQFVEEIQRYFSGESMSKDGKLKRKA